MDWILPGSSVHRILQARTLEWVAMPFSRGSSQHRDRTWVSCIAGRFFIFLNSLLSLASLENTHTHTHMSLDFWMCLLWTECCCAMECGSCWLRRNGIRAPGQGTSYLSGCEWASLPPPPVSCFSPHFPQPPQPQLQPLLLPHSKGSAVSQDASARVCQTPLSRAPIPGHQSCTGHSGCPKRAGQEWGACILQPGRPHPTLWPLLAESVKASCPIYPNRSVFHCKMGIPASCPKRWYGSNTHSHACVQSCPTLCDTMDCSPLGSCVHGFSRQEHWSGLSFPFPGTLPDPLIELDSYRTSCIGRRILYHWATWEAQHSFRSCCFEYLFPESLGIPPLTWFQTISLVIYTPPISLGPFHLHIYLWVWRAWNPVQQHSLSVGSVLKYLI